jgi:TonB family protein
MLGQVNCDTIGPRWYDPPIFGNSTKYSWEKLFEFLANELEYPKTAKADKIQGQVFVAFWIDTNGYTSEHTITQSIRQDLDDEVLRVAKLIKFDVPAKNVYGKPTGICFQLPIRFILNDTEFLFYKQTEKDKPVRKRKSKGGGSSEVIDNKKRNNGL